jgi:outer membrane autotransporter protein
VRSDVPFAEVASTGNQIAVAGMLDDLPASSPFLPLVAMLTGPQARAAFDGMSGEIYASTQSVLQQQSIYLRSTVNDRLRAAAGDIPTATELTAAPLAPGYTATVWMNGYGGWGSTDATANSASIDRSVAGFFAGLDVPLNEVWSLGFAGGYGSTNVDTDALASSGDIDSYDLAIYVGGKWGALGVRGGVAHSWNAVSVSRTVAFPGLVEGESADYDAGTTQVFGEVGYEVSYAGAKFEPFAGLAYVNVSTDAFTEQGGLAALTAQSGDQDNTYSTLGVRMSTDLPVANGRLAVRGLLGWQHAFGDVTPDAALDLAGDGGGFLVTGAPIDEDALLVGAGLDYLLNADLRLSLAYEGQIGAHANDNAVKASLSYRF